MRLTRFVPQRHTTALPYHHITLTSSFISDIIHSCPPLHPLPPLPADGESHLLDVLWACEAADWFDAASDSYLSAVSTTPLFSVSVCVLLPLCLPLKANLVAAFEQSLALMTARLQTLSVSSEQKVSWWYHDTNDCYSTSDMCDSFHLFVWGKVKKKRNTTYSKTTY